MKIKTASLVIIAVFAALIAVFSLISIPSPFGVPLTLQTFIIALAGFTLGYGRAFASVLIYIAVGITGIPVFSGFQGGFASIFGITGGFIIGFIPFVLLCGVKTRSFCIRIIFAVTGILICHLCGILWVCILGTDVMTAFLTVSAPYIIKDVISVVLALVISKKITAITQKFN